MKIFCTLTWKCLFTPILLEALVLLFIQPAYTEDNSLTDFDAESNSNDLSNPEDPLTELPPETHEPLPAIEVNSYLVTVVKKSHSNRVYLLQSAESQLHNPGTIILLRSEAEPNLESIMGLRILKTYPEKNQFAAKKISKPRKS